MARSPQDHPPYSSAGLPHVGPAGRVPFNWSHSHSHSHSHGHSPVLSSAAWPLSKVVLMADATPVSALPEAPQRGTADEAATVLRVSKSSVYRLMDDGVIASVRIGGRRFVVWDSVLRLLEPTDTAS